MVNHATITYCFYTLWIKKKAPDSPIFTVKGWSEYRDLKLSVGLIDRVVDFQRTQDPDCRVYRQALLQIIHREMKCKLPKENMLVDVIGIHRHITVRYGRYVPMLIGRVKQNH